jgi:PAS domain S-box-containing protein
MDANVPTGHLDDRSEFEALLADLSTSFINLSPSEVYSAIEKVQRRVCEALGVDLSALWEAPDGTAGPLTLTHYYSAQEGLEPPIIGVSAQEFFPWLQQEMLSGRSVAIASLDELPPAASLDRDNLQRFGVKSNVTVPLSVGRATPIGALGFNATRFERSWPNSLVQRLQLVAQVFANTLARKRSDETLRDSEERLALAAESAGAGLWSLDVKTGVFWASNEGRAVFGYGPDEAITMDLFEASVHPEDREHVRTAIKRSALAGVAVDEEYRIVNRTSDEMRWIASRGRPRFSPAGEVRLLMGVSIEITERKKAETELRELNRLLTRAHEDERALLAHQLQEDMAQRLAVLAIDIGLAESALKGRAHKQALASVREGIAALAEDIDSLVYHLHPSILDDLGLAEALRAECRRAGRRSNLEISLELGPLPSAIGQESALCLFRVAQEALANVQRHAGARAATITLRQADDGLLLAVRDDGVGFDPAATGRSRGIGLASIRERVRLVAGTLDISSASGQGTEIVAWVPAEGEAR